MRSPRNLQKFVYKPVVSLPPQHFLGYGLRFLYSPPPPKKKGSGSGFNQVRGSGSRRAKMTHKSRKNGEISCFEVLDVLF